MKMLNDYVMVKVDPNEEKTPSGIVIPNLAQERNNKGEVMFCGPGTKKSPMTVKPGDRVIWQDYDGYNYEYEGEEVVVLNCRDIVGLLL